MEKRTISAKGGAMEKTIMRMLPIIAALMLVSAASAQAKPIMCKNPKIYVCQASGCGPGSGGKHDEDVIVLDISEKVLTNCFGKDGKCMTNSVTVDAAKEGHIISGPGMALRYVNDELILAVPTGDKVVVHFYQCGKP